jgi:hypothetical protein
VLFLIVVGGIYTGIVTATESAALGGFAALVLTAGYLLRRERRSAFPKLASAARESASVSSMIFAILVGSTIFTSFLVQAQVPTTFANWVLDRGLPPLTVMIVLLVARDVPADCSSLTTYPSCIAGRFHAALGSRPRVSRPMAAPAEPQDDRHGGCCRPPGALVSWSDVWDQVPEALLPGCVPHGAGRVSP